MAEVRELKEKAIVIKTEDSGEADRILYLLTENRGLIRAKIKGVKKPRAKLAFASFPFCVGEYLLAVKAGGSVVTNCNFIENFGNLSTDLNIYYAGMAVLEALKAVSRENLKSTRLFLLALKTLNVLSYGENSNPRFVLCKFLYDLFAVVGYGIRVQENLDATGAVYFDFNAGQITNCAPTEGYKFTEKEKPVVQELTNPFDEANFQTPAGKNLLNLLIFFFERTTDMELSVAKKL